MTITQRNAMTLRLLIWRELSFKRGHGARSQTCANCVTCLGVRLCPPYVGYVRVR